jgi:DNA-directed RNA polymerase specialized sigma24 family protein
VDYVKNQAARHFSCPEDQEEMADDAWTAIWRRLNGGGISDAKKIAYREIHNAYERARRRRIRESAHKSSRVPKKRARIG